MDARKDIVGKETAKEGVKITKGIIIGFLLVFIIELLKILLRHVRM
jgi:hypothetical protein